MRKNEMTLKELREKRSDLIRRQQKEYTTLGNTQKCQGLWEEIAAIDKVIKERSKK